ncbi:MAG TPA: hypothetical protein DCX53_14050 [Anaerolineae bacterium]|nr:hypothetical protein [Anaerolineae bacterium]
MIGWSSARYLALVVTPPPGDQPPVKYRITATRLHVREGPATSYRSLGYVKQKDIVDVLSANADASWRMIRRDDGLVGWCSARYMTLVTA